MVKLKPWLTRILANLHNDHLRSKLQLKQQFSFKDELAITDQDPSKTASRDESVQHVRNAIAQLNDKHRKIVTLVDIAEYAASPSIPGIARAADRDGSASGGSGPKARGGCG